MTWVTNPFSKRMYLRIWLAVVCCVAVLLLVIGWAWQAAERYYAQQVEQTKTETPRVFSLLTEDGQQVLARGVAQRLEPGGPDFQMLWTTEDGKKHILDFGARTQRPPRPPDHAMDFWLKPPFGFLWLLVVVGIAVLLGVFPIIRHLMKRLESLRQSVQRFGEGDLGTRVAEKGHDEVAELSRQFNAAAARIESLVNSHKTLLANTSHELRSPLARIRMGMELVPDGPSANTDPIKAEMRRNIAELDQLIDEILLASRLDLTERPSLMLESIDMLGLAAEEAARIGAQVELLQPSDDTELQGDAKLLRRAIRNLLENARRYSEGPVELELLSTAHAITVYVKDRGPGVAEGQKEKIFTPFYRAPGASERSGGVGLGLSLVSTIAQHHQGLVHCEDRPGGGAVFVLTLPKAA